MVPCPPNTPRRPRDGVFAGSHPLPGERCRAQGSSRTCAVPTKHAPTSEVGRVHRIASPVPHEHGQTLENSRADAVPTKYAPTTDGWRVRGIASPVPSKRCRTQGSSREGAVPMITPPPPRDGWFEGSHARFRASDAVPGEYPRARGTRNDMGGVAEDAPDNTFQTIPVRHAGVAARAPSPPFSAVPVGYARKTWKTSFCPSCREHTQPFVVPGLAQHCLAGDAAGAACEPGVMSDVSSGQASCGSRDVASGAPEGWRWAVPARSVGTGQ